MFKKTVLDSGITVVTETHRFQRSVAIGAFILTGTRDEHFKQKGISHFVEHMVFKGTKKRSASDIARSLEAVGGDLNAYTTREYTCFHALSLRENLKLDMEVLGDLVTNATFSQREFDREKKVIMQEVLMNEDTPDEYIHDLFFEKAFGNSPLGWPILGTEQTLEGISCRDIKRYYRERYCGKNIIIAAAGSLEHNEVVDLVEKYFKVKKQPGSKKRRNPPQWVPLKEISEKAGEQTHILMGFMGPGFTDPKRFDSFVLNAWMGGGMSSQLYQSIRERRGLAYTVYSSLTTFTDCGTLTIYVGTDEKSLPSVFEAIEKDFRQLKKKKLTDSALQLFKQQVRGGILLGADDMENRMTSLGVNEMTFGEYVPVDDVVEELMQVDATEVKDLARELLNPDKMALLVMGEVDKIKTQNLLSDFSNF